MKTFLTLPLLTAAFFAGSVHALPVISDSGFNDPTNAFSDDTRSVSQAAPIYDEWVTRTGGQEWILAGTTDTYAEGIASSNGDRFLFQMIEDNKNTTGQITVQYDLNNLDDTPTHSLNLYVYGFNTGDTWTIDTSTQNGTSAASFSDVTALPTATSGWTTFTTDVDLGGTGYDQIAIGFGFSGLNTLGTGDQLQLDNVSIIPEPASLALVGIALASLLFFRRR